MQAYYRSNEGPSENKLNDSLSSSLGGSQQELDPWTLYELEKETQKLSGDEKPKRIKGSKESSKKKSGPSPILEISFPAVGGKQRSRRSLVLPERHTAKQRSRRSLALPDRHQKSDAKKMIESSKSKRQSLLMEVTVKNLYDGRKPPQTAPSSCMDDSLSSLPGLEDDDENTTTLFDDDEDFHKSCYF